jgi:hypothetical protein
LTGEFGAMAATDAAGSPFASKERTRQEEGHGKDA